MTDQEANKSAVSAYFEQLLNAGNLSITPDVFHDDAKFHYPLGELSGSEKIRNHLTAVRQGFPDIHFSICHLFGERELVACRWILDATQTGEFGGKPGTGKRVCVPGNTIFRCREGRIQEMWVAFNPDLLL